MIPSSVLRRAVLLSVLSFAFVVPAQAATIDLGGVQYVTYGDGNSYSLPIANIQFGFDAQTGPYTIQSSPGQISDLVVVFTGADGNPITTNDPSMDNAYESPTGSGGLPYFYPSDLNDNGTSGTVNDNGTLTWDASVASLLAFLGTDEMVFFFNNNQENSGGSSNQELAAWARIWVTDDNGNVLGTFEFTNDNSPYALVTEGGGGDFLGNPTLYTATGAGAGDPTVTSALNTDFVLSGGQICVEYVPLNLAFPPIPVPCGSALNFYAAVPGAQVSGAINHNLGANNAAYAVVFPELTALLQSLAGEDNLSQYTLHFDGRFGCYDSNLSVTAPGVSPWMPSALANGHGTCLNNGYEQLFIGTADLDEVGPAVPEPGTVTLLALGLSMVGLAVRRRRVVR